MTGKTLMEEQPVAWRYKSDAPKSKWTVQKNEPTQIQKWPGYTVEPLYSAAYVTQLKQERDELRRAMEWQPIETAPTEGKFLAEAKTGDWIVVERYDNPHGFKNTVIDNRNGKWWVPARWMPLPPAPSALNASNREGGE